MKNFIYLLFVFIQIQCFAQNEQSDSTAISDSLNKFQILEQRLKDGSVVQVIVNNGDTTLLYTLKTFKVASLRPYRDMEKEKKFRRLRYHVTKVYPYAKIAAQKLQAYNEEISKIPSKRKQKKYIKQREEELKNEFEETIKKLTVTQGKILIKLIDRETGESTYDILKEMRGGFKAFIWQGVAKLYGSSLKLRYDPEHDEEDEMIERICQMIEEGQI
ncbi:MAG: DUF4294 domain-containing protein [Vicingaceae bacterium]